MHKVIVPRSQWLRGKSGHNSMLFDPDTNTGCCLGHALSQICEVPLASMGYLTSPASVVHKMTVPENLVTTHAADYLVNSVKCALLMKINDDTEITDTEREAALIDGGVDVGIEFSFIE